MRTPDAVRKRLDGFAADLAADLHGMVEVDDDGETLSVVLTPRAANALAVTWFDDGRALQVETMGGPGDRWELARTPEAADFLEALVRSVVAGRAKEVFTPHRSQVTVTLADGSTVTETGSVGLASLLPRPGWQRRGRTVRYQPYRCR